MSEELVVEETPVEPKRRGRPRREPAPVNAPETQPKPGVFTVKTESSTEIWQAATPARTWVWVRNQLTGGWKQVRVGGKGSRRLSLTSDERRYNQDLVPEENIQLDPFSNGQLVCVLGDEAGTGVTDEDLTAILLLEDEAAFQQAANALESEVMVRRLLSLAEKTSTIARFTFIRDLIDMRYRVGGTQSTVQAMIDAGERISGYAG